MYVDKTPTVEMEALVKLGGILVCIVWSLGQQRILGIEIQSSHIAVPLLVGNCEIANSATYIMRSP